MTEKEIEELLEKLGPRDLEKIIRALLGSPLGRLIKILVVGGQIPVIKETGKESVVGYLDAFGQGVVSTQENLFREINFLETLLKQTERNMVKRRETEIKVSALKREREMWGILLRLIIDKVGGTATCGINEVAIMDGDKIVRTDSGQLLFPPFYSP